MYNISQHCIDDSLVGGEQKAKYRQLKVDTIIRLTGWSVSGTDHAVLMGNRTDRPAGPALQTGPHRAAWRA
jgi:hypothetical protein